MFVEFFGKEHLVVLSTDLLRHLVARISISTKRWDGLLDKTNKVKRVLPFLSLMPIPALDNDIIFFQLSDHSRVFIAMPWRLGTN